MARITRYAPKVEGVVSAPDNMIRKQKEVASFPAMF